MSAEFFVFLTALVSLATAVVTGSIIIYRAVQQVHKTVNSRMDELLELTRQTAYAAGVLKEKERRDADGDA